MIHLILTRFNLQYEADNRIGIEEQWLESRLKLFEQYCLPSIQKQTAADFIWLLLCNEETPKRYKQQLEEYKTRVPQLEIVYCEWVEDVNTLYHRIGQCYAKEGEILLTTRLDNDDRLSPAYIERVQEIAAEMSNGFISFPEGRQTFVGDHRSYRIRYIANHFTTRIEDTGYRTVLGFDHTRLTQQNDEVRIVDTREEMWEELVHGDNITNDYQPAFRYRITSASDIADLSRRWWKFQTRRVYRLLKRLFVASNQR